MEVVPPVGLLRLQVHPTDALAHNCRCFIRALRKEGHLVREGVKEWRGCKGADGDTVSKGKCALMRMERVERISRS